MLFPAWRRAARRAAYLVRSYKAVVEASYAPGGAGMDRARASFHRAAH